jgi:hypothetical protein
MIFVPCTLLEAFVEGIECEALNWIHVAQSGGLWWHSSEPPGSETGGEFLD